MKYFLDQEFIEGKQDIYIKGYKAATILKVYQIILFLSFMIISLTGIYRFGWIESIIFVLLLHLADYLKKYDKTKNTIDLISIGIVAEDGREYYAISNEFNLDDAWNRYDIKTTEYTKAFGYEKEYETEKVYWIRENVLMPIYYDLCLKENNVSVIEYGNYNNFIGAVQSNNTYKFVYKNFKSLLAKYGKSNKCIAAEIKSFTLNDWLAGNGKDFYSLNANKAFYAKRNPVFYGYYADYDWVCFCWLFGKMNDLPEGFPMYCVDLRQALDEKLVTYSVTKTLQNGEYVGGCDPYYSKWEDHANYPKQTNEHHALSDARFCHDLYKFIQSL